MSEKLKQLHVEAVAAAVEEAKYEEQMHQIHGDNDGWRGTSEHWKIIDQRSGTKERFYKHVDELTGGDGL